MNTAYYNEIDPFCCDVLRDNVVKGRLPKGFVDERDVTTIGADELVGYRQWHLFAGIGGIPYGLKLAGMPDDFPILTGGFPCQDISVAGKGAGLEGARSGLYWQLHRIVAKIRPRWLLLENVPALRNRGANEVLLSLAKIGYVAWPLVVGADDLGAPHRRKRVWIVAYAERPEWRAGAAGRFPTEHAGNGLHAEGEEGASGPGEFREALANPNRPGNCGLPFGAPEKDAWPGFDGESDVALSSRNRRREGGTESTRQQGRLDAAFSGSAMADTDGDRQQQPRWRVGEEWERAENSGGEFVADAAQQRERESHETQCAVARQRAREDAGWRSLELGDTDCTGLAQRECQRRDNDQEQSPPVGAGRLWPAGPAEPQYEWEYARTCLPTTLLNLWAGMRARYPEALRTAQQKREAEKNLDLALGTLDGAVDGLSARLVRRHQVASLSALGNAVVPAVVEAIGRAILAADERMRRSKQ